MTVPDWLTFQAVATIVVLFLVGRAFYVEETRVTVTEGWLRAKLVEYGFNEGDALAHAKEGVHYLGDHRMWDQRRVEKMLTSSYVRSTLERFYGEILDRKPDPEGVCQWGAMLYNAPRLERKRMEDHVRERIEKRKLEGWA